MRRKQVLRRSWAFFLGNCFINILNYRLGGIRQEKENLHSLREAIQPNTKKVSFPLRLIKPTLNSIWRAIELFHIVVIELNTFSAQMKVTPQKKNPPTQPLVVSFCLSSELVETFIHFLIIIHDDDGSEEKHITIMTRHSTWTRRHNIARNFHSSFLASAAKKTKAGCVGCCAKWQKSHRKNLSSLLKLPSRRTTQHTWYVPETWSIRYLNSSRVSLEIQRPIVSKFLLIRQFLS